MSTTPSIRPMSVALFAVLSALTSAPSCRPGGAGGACSCDNSAENSKCVEMSAPAAYATQLASTCSTVESGCDSTTAVYDDVECPQGGVVATCVVDYFSYVETQYWYSTGGEPWSTGDADIEEDCPGELTWN